MINLRYHIVSITAVFLALGIGVTMGSSFLGRAALDQIQRNLNSAERRIRETRADNADLQRRVERLESTDEQLEEQGADRVFAAALPDVPVLIVANEGSDEASLERLATALENSGAAFRGTLVLDSRLALDDQEEVEALAEVLGISSTDTEGVRADLVEVLASGIRASARPAAEEEGSTSTVPGAPDATPPDDPEELAPAAVEAGAVLEDLVTEGFATYSPPEDGGEVADLLAGPGQRYVFVSGPQADLADEALMLPLLRRLARQGETPVVVASAATGEEPDEVRDTVVEPLRSDEDLADRISTVDHLEQFAGLTAVVLALEDLGAGRYGHYGVGSSVDALIPAAPDE